VSNLVVTSNFDDFISRALTLFGKSHIVCDHPLTVERINPEENDTQIVHVHGSYWFYDCCNLRGELEQRAELSKATTLTMAALLDNIISHRSPIVVGYSGWEGDVIMRTLQRHLVKTLAYKLYWFCYQRNHITFLPAWLRAHPNVQFVLPTTEKSLQVDETAARLSLETDEVELRQQKAMESSGNAEPTLSAEQVFDALIEKFALSAPELTQDPLAFFAKQLRRSLPDENNPNSASDIYLIRSVIERVERANAGLAGRLESPLEEVRNSVRRSRYREAVQLAKRVVVNNLTDSDLLEFMDSMWSSARGLNDNSDEELEAYDLVVRSGNAICDRDLERTPVLKVAMALLYKGLSLGELHRSEEEIEVYDELIEKFGDATEASVKEQVVTAMRCKGFVLGTLKRSQEELDTYNELITKFGDAVEPGVREELAAAMQAKGMVLATLKRHDEAIALYDDLIRQFGSAAEPAVREVVAGAMRGKGIALSASSRNEEAIAVYDELIKKFGDATESGVRQEVAGAMRGKGFRLGKLRRNEEAITVYDELIRKFGDAADPGVRVQVAAAMRNKGARLSSLKRSKEEIAVYDELVKKFSDAAEPGVRGQIAIAMRTKGDVFFKLKLNEEAITAYDELIKKFADATEPGILEQVATAMRTKAGMLATLKRKEDAMAVYNELIKKFGGVTAPGVAKIVKEATALLQNSQTNQYN